jgi:hypothetical protein
MVKPRRMGCTEQHVARLVENECIYILAGNFEGKRKLFVQIPKHRLEDSIKIDIREI